MLTSFTYGLQGEYTAFKPYMHRYHVPYRASKSTSPLWYSIKRASAYIIVLSSYSAYGIKFTLCSWFSIRLCGNKMKIEWFCLILIIAGKYTPQYSWLEKEFHKVNRAETPWLIVLVHSPWYNSNNYYYMEGESMRVMFESWFCQQQGRSCVGRSCTFIWTLSKFLSSCM